MNFWQLIAGATAIPMLMMVIVWACAKRMNNAGIVDIWWSFGFAPVALFCAAFGSGDSWRRAAAALMVCIWSLRLGSHLYRRVMGHHPAEDPRYAELRAQFPERTWLMFFGFFQLQGVLVGLLSMPVALACSGPSRPPGAFEAAGLLLWLVAIAGESLADRQLAAFRRLPENKGQVCDAGLWRCSRHPNYFFEWLIWVSFFVYALGSPWGWAGILSPLLMLFFLTCVTGIPPSEAHSLKSRGDAYRAYQRRTSPFIPWFPKQN